MVLLKQIKKYYMKLIVYPQFIEILTSRIFLCIFKIAKNTRSALHSGFLYTKEEL